MSYVSLTNFLKDLGDDDLVAGRRAASDGLDEILEGEGRSVQNEGRSDAIESAYRRGLDEGRREVEARMVHDVGEVRARCERQLEEARQAWANLEGQRMAEQLESAVREMHTHLADAMAEILLPIIEKEVRGEAIRKIAEAVKRTEPGDWQGPVVVRAPADLLEAMRRHLAGAVTLVEFQETEGREVEVTIDKTVLTTQLENWGAVVRRLLE